jgi:hypothetical protein
MTERSEGIIRLSPLGHVASSQPAGGAPRCVRSELTRREEAT